MTASTWTFSRGQLVRAVDGSSMGAWVPLTPPPTGEGYVAATGATPEAWVAAIRTALSSGALAVTLPAAQAIPIVSATLTIPPGVTLNLNGSTLDCPAPGFTVIVSEGATLEHFALTRGNVVVTGSGATVRHGSIMAPGTGVAVRMGDAATISDVLVEDVEVSDANIYGFVVANTSGALFLGEAERVRFRNCRALDTGTGANDWSVGFSLDAIKAHRDISFVDCLSDNSWESGFHIEGYGNGTTGKNIVFERCVSTNNGRKPSPMFGAGFFNNPDTTLIGCRTAGNTRAYFSDRLPGRLVSCVDEGGEPFTDGEASMNLLPGGSLRQGMGVFSGGYQPGAGYARYTAKGLDMGGLFELVPGVLPELRSLQKAGGSTGSRSITSRPFLIDPRQKYTFSFEGTKISGTYGGFLAGLVEMRLDGTKVADNTTLGYVDATASWATHSWQFGAAGSTARVLHAATRLVAISLVIGNYDGAQTDGIFAAVRDLKVYRD